MRAIKELLIILIVVFSLCVTANAEKVVWKKLKKTNGVQMFSRSILNSKFKEYKAVSYIDLPMEFLFEALLDIDNYPKWYPDCLEAKLLKSFDTDHVEGNFIIYFFLDAQWPAANRDVVVRSNSMHDWANGHVVIKLNKTPYKYPYKKGVQRMTEFKAKYDFQYITRTRTRVIYTSLADIGGRIPAGLVNATNKKLTAKTIINLREQAKAPIYKKKAMNDYL